MTAPNGRARPSLAQQIDRLDAILDGLADALNEAVGQAVRQSVAVAVRAAVAELLAHPDLQARLAQPAESNPSPIKRLLAAARRAAAKSMAALGRACRWTAGAIRRLPTTTRRVTAAIARTTWAGSSRLVDLTWRLRWPVLLALSVGGAVGWGLYVLGPTISASIGGLAGAANTLSARTRRLQGRMTVVAGGHRN
jgi:hypothetical protein